MADNQLENVLADLVTKLGDGAVKYGPQAFEMTGKYLQLHAILSLLSCAIYVAVASFLAKRLFAICTKNRNEEDCEAIFVLSFLASGILALTVFFIFVTGILNEDNWIAAASPRMALVQMAVQTVAKP